MGSSSSQPSTVEDSKKLEAPPNFRGASERKCTDMLFLIVIIAVWVAMTAVGIDSVENGDPWLLINGVDYNGRICGRDDGVIDKDRFYYIRTDGTGVCVDSCPSETDFSKLWGCTDDNEAFTAEGSSPLDCSGTDAATCASLTGATASTDFSASNFGGTGSNVCMFQMKTKEFLNHCVYSESEIFTKFVSFSDNISYMQEFMSDIFNTIGWTLGLSISLSFVLGFMYCILLRIPGVVSCLVWGSIICIFCLLIALGYASYNLYDDWNDDGKHDEYQVNACLGFMVIFFVGAALWVCLCCFMRKRIKLATGIIKESARAVNAMPAMILMPVIEVIGLVLFLVPWFYYMAYTAGMATVNSAEDDNSQLITTYSFDDDVKYRGWFLLFCFFWTSQFIIAVGHIALALTVVRFYFTRDRSTVGSGTFFASVKDTLVYHTGTAAFGSLIVAIIQMIRAIVAYIQKKAKASGNKVAQYVLCCCQCCVYCLEKCMKFLNKNAYIQTAIFSTAFCRSAKNAFWLIARNIARVGAVSLVSEFIVIIMKMLICSLVAGAVYLAIQANEADQVYSTVGPCVMAAVLAYFISGIFGNLFNITSLTILQCFIADEEMFQPQERYADNELREWVNSAGKGKRASSPRAGSPAGGGGVGVVTGTA